MHIKKVSPYLLNSIIRKLFDDGVKFTPTRLRMVWDKQIGHLYNGSYLPFYPDRMLAELADEGLIRQEVTSERMSQGSRTVYNYWYGD